MESLDVVRGLHEYNGWVNRRLFDVAAQVPAERIRERFGGSFDTILGTAAHILSGDTVIFARVTGGERPELPEATSIADVRARWEAHRAQIDAFIQAATPEQLGATKRFTTRTGDTFELPAWQIFLQMVNHGTHHRAELADMLTRVGFPPPPTDLIIFFQEQASQRQGGQ